MQNFEFFEVVFHFLVTFFVIFLSFLMQNFRFLRGWVLFLSKKTTIFWDFLENVGKRSKFGLKMPSLARSVPKPLKVHSLARSVTKPLKVPSLARSVPKPFIVKVSEWSEWVKWVKQILGLRSGWNFYKTNAINI